MKHWLKITLIVSLLSCFIAKAPAQNRFEISGILPDDGVDVELSSENPAFYHLKTRTKNKEFRFSGEMNQEFEYVHLRISKNNKYLREWAFYIRPGKMEIDVLTFKDNGSQNNIHYFNVPFIEEQKKYSALIKPLQDSLSSAFNLLRNTNNGYVSGLDADSLATVIENLRAEELIRKVGFVKNNSNAYIALHIFYKEILKSFMIDFSIKPDSLFSIYSAFDESLKETDLGRSVYAYISKKQSLLLNRTLPDFSFATNTGQHYKLSSFRYKKYVLLCFWDSYCSPCIRTMPLLKQLNQTYADKGLQMISVSIDRDTNKWLAALRKYELPWLQTCDLPPFVEVPTTRSLYDINYIPQYFLIDKEGRLIYHNTQLKDGVNYSVLQKMLDDLLH